jgi:hypothetical protein
MEYVIAPRQGQSAFGEFNAEALIRSAKSYGFSVEFDSSIGAGAIESHVGSSSSPGAPQLRELIAGQLVTSAGLILYNVGEPFDSAPD